VYIQSRTLYIQSAIKLRKYSKLIVPKYDPQPKRVRKNETSKADENNAYELATLRDDGVCVKCRRSHPIFGVNRDHRQNRKTGNTVVANIQLLCGSGTTGCHGQKTMNPEWALKEGWSVPSWADPEKWPARRWVTGRLGVLESAWVLYDNYGEFKRITDVEAEQLCFRARLPHLGLLSVQPT